MRICKHITFYYNEDRFRYLNTMLKEVNTYSFLTDVFVHTNMAFPTERLIANERGALTIIVHDLIGEHGYKLTWKCRALLKSQRDMYDTFIYVEDDILIRNVTLQYWSDSKDVCLANNYNVGFLRIEVDGAGTEFITDFPGERLDARTIFNMGGKQYILNNKYPYCAFWIYDKAEFSQWVDSVHYNIENITGYDVRESSAIGLLGKTTNWYKGTVLQIEEGGKIVQACKVYHLPNNYVGIACDFATIPFSGCVA